MQSSPYRKEWYVETNIAKGMLGLGNGSRIPTITEYASEFACSRGIVQNALSHLEDQKAITLERQGKRGTLLVDKKEKELFGLSGLRHLTASMPPPVNLHFAGLATGICQGMNHCPVPFTFAFVQGARNRVDALMERAYDFVVASRHSARVFTERYPEICEAFPFENAVYSPPHAIYVNRPGAQGLEKGMTLAVDPASTDQLAFAQRASLGRGVEIREMPMVSAINAFYTGKVDALAFRRGLEHTGDNLFALLLKQKDCLPPEQIRCIDLPPEDNDMECPVVLVHRDNYGISGILKNYLGGNAVASVQSQVLEGELAPQFY